MTALMMGAMGGGAGVADQAGQGSEGVRLKFPVRVAPLGMVGVTAVGRYPGLAAVMVKVPS